MSNLLMMEVLTVLATKLLREMPMILLILTLVIVGWNHGEHLVTQVEIRPKHGEP
jgi:lipopolysaccharide export system protein LptC